MGNESNNEMLRSRRRLLGGMMTTTGISAAAMLGTNTPAVAVPPLEHAPEDMFSLARLPAEAS